MKGGKMPGHNIRKIHELGVKQTRQALKNYGFTLVDKGNDSYAVAESGLCFLVNINVKPYTEYKGEKVTGKNTESVSKLMLKIKEVLCDDILVVFFDIKAKTIYGGELGYLNKPKTLGNCVFPEAAITHSGNITYWGVAFMETYGFIDKEDCDMLAKLRYENKFPKEQTNLF